MDTFDVIANALRSIIAHPKYIVPTLTLTLLAAFIGITAVIFLLVSVHSLISSSAPLLTKLITATVALLPVLIPVIIVLFLIGVLIKGIYIDLTYKWKLKRVLLEDSFNVAVKRYKDLLTYEIFVVLIDLVLAVVLVLPIIYLGYHNVVSPYINGAQISGHTFLSFLIPAILLGLIYAVAAIIIAILLWLGPSMIVLDGKNAITAFRASIKIGKKDWVRIFITMLIAFIVAGLMLEISSALHAIPLLGIVLAAIVNIIMSTFLQLIAPMYYITFYKKK